VNALVGGAALRAAQRPTLQRTSKSMRRRAVSKSTFSTSQGGANPSALVNSVTLLRCNP